MDFSTVSILLPIIATGTSAALLILGIRYKRLGRAFDGQHNNLNLLSHRLDDIERQKNTLAQKLQETEAALTGAQNLMLNSTQREDDLSLTSAASYAKTSRSTIRRWCKRGLPHRSVRPRGRITVIRITDLDTYLEVNR